MDVDALLEALRASPQYAGQIVHTRHEPARTARFADPAEPLADAVRHMLAARGIGRLYAHQAEAVDHARAGRDALIVTGTASGKSLCYVVPIVERLLADPAASALLLFPTKALSRDQFGRMSEYLDAAGLEGRLAGVYDGDTPSALRRRLRDHGSVILSNPDMLHAALLPQHARWARFLSGLRYLVIDELHVYNGMFGASMANLMRRFLRVCAHHGSRPQLLACSATVGNPADLARAVIGAAPAIVDGDGSPRGARTYLFWNPPTLRGTPWHSRRSAHVEAHEVMALLLRHGAPTIAFSKAKMTAEMIARYVRENLAQTAPALVGKVSAYRGGYRPEERREIERQLFGGELLGVSTTSALELGIDVGGLDAAIVVGYPGRLSSFFQQAGRAGRQEREALVILVGLDTPANQYVMSHPEYVFGRPVEQAAVDPDNPFVVAGHLRCAAQELPLSDADLPAFGPHASTAVRVLEDEQKVRRIGDRWYHASSEIPQHETSLRSFSDANVVIHDAESGEVVGELNKYDAPSIIYPGAIYMHRGDTYHVDSLDMDRNLAYVRHVQVDYYTDPLGGTDVHHIDHALRTKPFGTGTATWGEVTAWFRNFAYERIRFYTLDAVSVHPAELPPLWLETMAFWLVPPEDLMLRVRAAGLDPLNGLRGLGYATRMMLPLFVTCDTMSFSHTVGSANSPWNAMFVYERFPYGLGYTERAYEQLHRILPAVLDKVRECGCDNGCPCCVGKPLRGATVWNYERGEGSVPSRAATVAVLEGLLGDGSNLQHADAVASAISDEGHDVALERALRRRMERQREPEQLHAIEPMVPVEYPRPETPEALAQPDVERRIARRSAFERELRKRMEGRPDPTAPPPRAAEYAPPPGIRAPGGVNRPGAFAPEPAAEPPAPDGKPGPVTAGESLAARARRLKRERDESP